MKKLPGHYCHELVYHRYRYDIKMRKRFETTEAAIETIPAPKGQYRLRQNRSIGKKLHPLIRHAVGRWDEIKEAWRLPYGMAARLGLKERMVP